MSFRARKNKNLSSGVLGFFFGGIWMVLIKRNYTYHRSLWSWQPQPHINKLIPLSANAQAQFPQWLLSHNPQWPTGTSSPHFLTNFPPQRICLEGTAVLHADPDFPLPPGYCDGSWENFLSQLGVGHHAEKWLRWDTQTFFIFLISRKSLRKKPSMQRKWSLQNITSAIKLSTQWSFCAHCSITRVALNTFVLFHTLGR